VAREHKTLAAGVNDRAAVGAYRGDGIRTRRTHARPSTRASTAHAVHLGRRHSSAVFAALVRERRSVHAFDPAPIADEDVRASLELALLAPSSFNLQPYEFIRVRDPERRSELARLCLGQRPAQTAQELIVCVARWDRWRETAAEHDAWLAGHPQVTDEAGATHLYPLTDFQPRKEENLERGYLQGRYGAIPCLGDLLPAAGEAEG
jgi:hypothetical protein